MSKLVPIIASIIIGLWIFIGLNGMGQTIDPEAILKQEVVPIDSTPKGPAQLPFLIGGVQMNEGNQINWVKKLRSSGMNTVEVTVYANQGRWFDNNLWFSNASNSTLEEIRVAKLAGMKVVLILRLQLDHSFPENKFLWHGMVYPRTYYLLNRWFENYSRFVRMWGHISEREGVDVLVIGSEMNALFASIQVQEVPSLESYILNKKKQAEYSEKLIKVGKERLTSQYLSVFGEPNYTDLATFISDRSECQEKWAEITSCSDSLDRLTAINRRRVIQNFYWEKLIWSLRNIYQGKLSVAANFDNFEQIKFWKELDYIGINAYFPLRKIEENQDSLEEQFKEGWEKVLKQIMDFRDTMGITHIPVLFTELGYTKYSGSGLAPWQGEGFSLIESPNKDSVIIWDQQPVDYSERNTAVKTLVSAVKKTDFPLAGVLYWKFTSWKHQVKEDPFALLIGPESEDSLQYFLRGFK